MYVQGTLQNDSTVLVDIGTGYFVKKVRRTTHEAVPCER